MYVRYCIRDVIYMCGIEFVMRWMCYIVFMMLQMWYISFICCVCDYRIKKQNKKKINFWGFVGCPGPGTRQSWEFWKEFPALPSARSRAPSKVFSKKKSLPGAPWPGTRQRNYEKNKKLFAGCPCGATPSKEIIKKIKKIFARCLPGTAPGKENLKKKIKKIFAGCLWYGTRQSKGWRSRRRNDHFSLPGAGFALGKVFAGCPIKSTRQRNLCRLTFCRRLFTECCTRQRLCRVQSSLCWVHSAPGKAPESSSVRTLAYSY